MTGCGWMDPWLINHITHCHCHCQCPRPPLGLLHTGLRICNGFPNPSHPNCPNQGHPRRASPHEPNPGLSTSPSQIPNESESGYPPATYLPIDQQSILARLTFNQWATRSIHTQACGGVEYHLLTSPPPPHISPHLSVAVPLLCLPELGLVSDVMRCGTVSRPL
ncbi:hypothetical protein B0T18DRAFT_205272 [Schizothecium vesticola]|uniref:Uncharacterized protein n=1 Tax=Schizothecium vesticola TaxID=314040 RepID=A0AA40EJ33_9PEZI|nr:hypothetical protein B0T18DRAFT_205272 [Schizothecium vesticola]